MHQKSPTPRSISAGEGELVPAYSFYNIRAARQDLIIMYISAKINNF